MRECIKTDNPEVTVVMAVYNPDKKWLYEQLCSLNNQDYRNMRLIVADDCSTSFTLKELEIILSQNLLNFEYKVFRNKENIGSTKTFEKLTEMAETELIAYCDQDDIWDKDKISMTVKKLMEENSSLCCSDVRVIDGSGRKIADSVKEIWKRQEYKEGENLARILLKRNFVIGCTVVMKTGVAKSAIPFCREMVHDQWLAIHAALNGKISVCDKSNMSYRIHGTNQTGTLAKICTKEDYYTKRIYPYYFSMQKLYRKFVDNNEIAAAYRVAELRNNYYKNGNIKNFLKMISNIKYDKKVIGFEIISHFISEKVFKELIFKIQRS